MVLKNLENAVKKLGHELNIQGTKIYNNIPFPNLDNISNAVLNANTGHKKAIAEHACIGLMLGAGGMGTLMAFGIHDYGAPFIALGAGAPLGVGKYFAQEAYYSITHSYKNNG